MTPGGFVDLELTAEQRDVAATFERVLARESTTDRVRAAEDSGFDNDLWKKLAELDTVGVAVPSAAGGVGSGLVEMCLVAESAGRHLACVPLVEACAAAMLLAEAGGHAELLDDALTGGAVVVFAPRPAEAGVATLVPGGAAANAVVAMDEGDLVLAAGQRTGVVGDLGYQGSADRPLAGDGVDRQVLASGDRAAELWRRGRGWWRLMAAAVCQGLAQQALDVAVDYAKTREQFGVPIGSFQAISHLLADVAMAADGARLLSREAAWRHDDSRPDWPDSADTAFAHAAETAVRAAEACLHVHGGYGYTLEYDAQLYLRRAKAMLLQAGDPEGLWESIGATAVEGAP